LFPEPIQLRIFQTAFTIGLFLTLFTKRKNEDERSLELRMIVSSWGFYAIVILLLIFEIFGMSVNFTFTHQAIFDACLVYIFALTLLFEMLIGTVLLDKAQENKDVFRMLVFALLILSIIFNKWFWVWVYPYSTV
jgi:hypothetical protein